MSETQIYNVLQNKVVAEGGGYKKAGEYRWAVPAVAPPGNLVVGDRYVLRADKRPHISVECLDGGGVEVDAVFKEV